MSTISYSDKIPNNINLSQVRTLQQALEQWQPNIDKRIAAIAADRDYWREQAIAAQASAHGEAVVWIDPGDFSEMHWKENINHAHNWTLTAKRVGRCTLPLYTSAPAAPEQADLRGALKSMLDMVARGVPDLATVQAALAALATQPVQAMPNNYVKEEDC